MFQEGCDPFFYIYSRWLEAKLKEVVMIQIQLEDIIIIYRLHKRI
uniref:Translation initiation factor 1 n=6 Tax=Citrus TaxID=2706 RepID=A0A7M1I9A0_CITJP|nr:translation initiation factor 1 [Citrus platymamma]YP_009988474.1 translation initiation factor 1 [Citrus sunki]YP_010017114.1 translation initiation factor 1 [Citrus cavaleriei]YP_010017203.1 translation initiation factor 1 [Citrus hongheensis]YP_010025725.1 translation initiation factor 1 [Citrus japonica]QOJ46035.1 translation initiation factor 1 [Citrus x limon]UIG87791.1 translational initiation factor 1 [Citrus x aurantium]ALI86697.1 translation initiation factor 1 [Citrus platymamm